MSIFYTYDETTHIFTGILESDVKVENATMISPNNVLLNDNLNTLVFDDERWVAKNFNDLLTQYSIPSRIPDEKDKQIANLSIQIATQSNQNNHSIAQMALTIANLQIQLNAIQGGK